jgi:hypothetical protein
MNLKIKITLNSLIVIIMSPTELKMQPTIHLERRAEYGRGNIQLCYFCIADFCYSRILGHSVYVTSVVFKKQNRCLLK